MTAVSGWDDVSDADLATAAAAGDRAAFAGIYDRYANRLHDFCLGMLRSRDTAADCVQDVFCIAATRLGQLKDPDKLRPWLYSIARNEALRCIREAGRERTYDEVPEVVSDEPGPDIMAARTELATLVAEAAGGLSERDREVLDLSYRHGLDGPELAQALGVSHANAKKLVQRLRDTVEKSLGALLVSRRAAGSCPELAIILDGWDGRFTALMRKRIARHIETCATCDGERARLVNPVALLGATPVLVPAPAWLRQRTLDRIQLPPASQNGYFTTDSEKQPVEDKRGRRRLMAGAIVAVIIAAAVSLTVARLLERSPAVSPANHTSTAPAPTSAPQSHAPQLVTVPPPPAPTIEAPRQTPDVVTPQPSTPTPHPVTTAVPATTSRSTPTRTMTAPPATPIAPTFTAPTSSNSPTTTPPSTVSKPPVPVIRPTATVLKPPPVTTTPPILQ